MLIVLLEYLASTKVFKSKALDIKSCNRNEESPKGRRQKTTNRGNKNSFNWLLVWVLHGWSTFGWSSVSCFPSSTSSTFGWTKTNQSVMVVDDETDWLVFGSGRRKQEIQVTSSLRRSVHSPVDDQSLIDGWMETWPVGHNLDLLFPSVGLSKGFQTSPEI